MNNDYMSMLKMAQDTADKGAFMESARTLFGIYSSCCEVGFTDAQAMFIVAQFIQAAQDTAKRSEE